MGRRLYFIIILFVSLLNTHLVSAQCNSKVKANAKLISNELGEIKVDITTAERFECKLNTISGKGQDQVSQQAGNGSSTITFSDLDITKIYQVEVEFITEENKLCKKLQQNDLIFESR